MSKVDFGEVAEGVARKSESKASTPETKGLIRALLKRSPQEAPAGDLRDFVRALIEGRTDHASFAHRALITAVQSGQESTAPYDQRDLARALIREFGTEHRRRGLAAGLEAEDLEDLNRALRSHSDREIDWPDLRSLARALIDLSPSKAPTSDWQHFVEALRTGRPEKAPSSLEPIARAAIQQEPDRAPSGWPRTLAAMLVANKIPKPVARISAEKESDLKGLVKAVEKGDRYAVSVPALRDLEEAIRKGDKWRAPEKYRGFVDALLKGEPSRAPEGELREIAKAVVKKKPGDLQRGVLRDLAEALVQALEPPAPAPGSRSGASGSRTNSRREPESPASSEKGPLGRWIAAGLLAADSEEVGGNGPVPGARRDEMPASRSGGESSPWDEIPEVQEELREDAPPTFRNLYLKELDRLGRNYSKAQLERVETYRLASDSPFLPDIHHISRCYFRTAEALFIEHATPEQTAEVLISLESALGIPPRAAAIMRAGAIDGISEAKAANDDEPEAQAAFVDALRRLLPTPAGDEESVAVASEAPGSVLPPPVPVNVSPVPKVVPASAAGAWGPPKRGAVAAFVKASLVAVLGLVALIGVSNWLQSDRPSSQEPASSQAQAGPPDGGSAGGVTVESVSPENSAGGDAGSVAPGTDTAAPEGDALAATATSPDDAVPSEGTDAAEGEFGESTGNVPSAKEDPTGSGTSPSMESPGAHSPAPAAEVARPKTPAELAWWNGDWNAVYTLDLAPAEAGDHEAQVRLGRLFYDGLGRQANPRTAEAWFRKAAATGSAEAKYRLGLLYSDNRPNAPWDLDVARQFFIEAAGTHAMAALKLGHYYAKGIGVSENHEEARKWFQQAASLGNPEAADWLRLHR